MTEPVDPHTPPEVDILASLRDLATNSKSEKVKLDALRALAAYRPPEPTDSPTVEHETVNTVYIPDDEPERRVLVVFKHRPKDTQQ